MPGPGRPSAGGHAEPPVHLMTAPEEAWRQSGPSVRAVRSLGVRSESLQRLPGGQGLAWTDGRLVVKPVGCRPEHDWLCEVYAAWRGHDEVRVPEPVRPRPYGDGDETGWSVDGWGAHVFVTGRDLELPGEAHHVRSASAAFHAQVAPLPRPAFLDDRDDPWAFGDRLAWESAEPAGDAETLAVIETLRAHLAPVTTPNQVIHGDLLPNVLLAPGLPPAVIDWPPYYRPAGMADAIAVTDVVTFRQAPLAWLDDWAAGPDWDQLLIRALLYRLGPTGLFAQHHRLRGGLVTHVERVRPVVEAVLSRGGRTG